MEQHGRIARRSGHDQQVGLSVPRAETRGRRRRRSLSRSPDSRRPSPTSGTHHYLPPTSSFSRSRSHSRSRSRGPRASIHPAYPLSPYQTHWGLDLQAGSSTPVIPPLASQRAATPEVRSHLERHVAPYVAVDPFLTPPVIASGLNPRTGSSPPFIPLPASPRSVTPELRSNLEHHATPYVAVDPFLTPPVIASGLPLAHKYYGNPTPSVVYPSPGRRILFKALVVDVLAMVAKFIFDAVPRQLYLHFLLRLPYFYFSRVARIFEEAEMSMLEIKEMGNANVDQHQHNFIEFPQTVYMGPHMLKLKASWEGFIDSVLREWKTLNIISVLLLSYVFGSGGLHYLLMLEQGHSHNFTDSRCRKRSPNAKLCTFFSHMCLDESVVWVHVYYPFRDYEKTPQSRRMGRGKWC